jgi:hypothetical protein
VKAAEGGEEEEGEGKAPSLEPQNNIKFFLIATHWDWAIKLKGEKGRRRGKRIKEAIKWVGEKGREEWTKMGKTFKMKGN